MPETSVFPSPNDFTNAPDSSIYGLRQIILSNWETSLNNILFKGGQFSSPRLAMKSNFKPGNPTSRHGHTIAPVVLFPDNPEYTRLPGRGFSSPPPPPEFINFQCIQNLRK